MCNDFFGNLFTLDYIEELVQGSNDFYGGTDLNVQNVVFVHGSIDPWHAVGRLTDLNENSPSIVIPGEAITFAIFYKIIAESFNWNPKFLLICSHESIYFRYVPLR